MHKYTLIHAFTLFCKHSVNDIFNLVAAMVTGLKITVGDDVTLSWSQPDPPHGIILYYNIKITELKNMYTTVLTGYTQTSITKSALTHSLNVTKYEAVITLQVP